jgi:hypothetical protein
VLRQRTSRQRFIIANLYQIAISIDLHNDGSEDIIIPVVAGQHHETSHEPYIDQWQRRLASKGGVLFFKHKRKAGGTSVHNYLHAFLIKHHGHGTFQQFLQSIFEEEVIRHFPFLDSEQKQIAQRYFNSPNDRLQHHSQTPKKCILLSKSSALWTGNVETLIHGGTILSPLLFCGTLSKGI